MLRWCVNECGDLCRSAPSGESTGIAAFAHETEAVCHKAGNRASAVAGEPIELTISTKDLVKVITDPPSEAQQKTELQEAVNGFRQSTPSGKEVSHPPETSLSSAWASLFFLQTITGENNTHRIRFERDAGSFDNGTHPLLLLDQLSAIGECEACARLDAGASTLLKNAGLKEARCAS
jgi:two-component system chemotaxis sensor kinase CheA